MAWQSIMFGLLRSFHLLAMTVNFAILNLVKSFLTSIKFTFDNLSRKIKNPCLVINKNFLKEDFTIKSKQIIIMLLSFIILFTISCKNDDKTGSEGGISSIPTDSGNPATVGNATFTDTLTRTALNLKGISESEAEEGIAPATFKVALDGDSELIIAGNKVSFRSLGETQLFTSGDNKVVEASVEYSDAGTTVKEYIKITLNNASTPTTAQVEYQTGFSDKGIVVTATYTGNLTKQ